MLFYFQELLLIATFQRGSVSEPAHLLCQPGTMALFFSVMNPDATRTCFDREPDRLQKIPLRTRIVWLRSLFIMTLNTSLSSWTNTKNNPVCVCSAYHSHALHPRDWAGGGWWVCSMMCHCRFSLCLTQQHKTHTHPLLMTWDELLLLKFFVCAFHHLWDNPWPLWHRTRLPWFSFPAALYGMCTWPKLYSFKFWWNKFPVNWWFMPFVMFLT